MNMNKRRLTINVDANIAGRHSQQGTVTQPSSQMPSVQITPQTNKKLKNNINYEQLLVERCKKL